MWKCPICEKEFNYDLTRFAGGTPVGYIQRAKHLKQTHGIIVAEISVQRRNNDNFILKYYNELKEWNERKRLKLEQKIKKLNIRNNYK